MFSNVVMESFLGGDIRNATLGGMPLNKFITKLVDATADQGSEFLSFILGKKYLELGIWKVHREINDMIRLYREWGIKFIEKRIEEEKQNLAKFSIE